MRSFLRTAYLLLGVVWLCEFELIPAYPAAFDIKAVSSPPGPGLHVVVSWLEVPGTISFNLYRKTNLIDPYTGVPLNGGAPITIATDCIKITTILTFGSVEWDIIRNGLADNIATPFDPCKVATIPRSATKFAQLEVMARAKWKIAVVIGQGFDDKTVVNGTKYFYELRGVDSTGKETGVLATDVSVNAGSPTLVPAPAGLKATAGDSKVLLQWDDVTNAAGFNVYRALNIVGPYQRINDTSFSSRIASDLDGNPISPSTNGFIDFQRWNASGNPISHLVKGFFIAGPTNGTNYFYQAASVDLLEQEGPKSGSVTAKPLDKTPPMTPSEINVTANNTAGQLEITWAKVTYDIAGHTEPISGYKVYRYEIPDSTAAVQIGGLYPQPAGGIIYASAIDADSILRPLYGEQPFYYRIECLDTNGNVSARSAVASGKLNDITPPASPKNVSAEGFEEFILIKWELNTEPDMDGYLIYRSLCDFGKWVCDPSNKNQNPDVTTGGNKRCPEFFSLVGYLSQLDAKTIAGGGITTYFEDHSVPQGSPLCYAYWVKAQDKSQNQSGKWPVPDFTKETIVCQRLRDKTPPDPAIVSGLFARDTAIRVEWIGAPVQDIAAYHVYRSDTEPGPYAFVGGMTVAKPPAVPVVLLSPYTPPAVVGCDTIPLDKQDYMSAGVFLDKPVNPKQIYWYKVLGIDQVGNETTADKGVPVSTFTFSRNKPGTPIISSVDITNTTGTCALVVHWAPSFDPTVQRGFVVFRSETALGLYRQIAMVAANEFVDTTVVRGVEYWYKVCQMSTNNILSQLSTEKNGKVTP